MKKHMLFTAGFLLLSLSAFADMDRNVCLSQLRQQIEKGQMDLAYPSGAAFNATVQKMNQFSPSTQELQVKGENTYQVSFPSEGQSITEMTFNRKIKNANGSRALSYTIRQQRQASSLYSLAIEMSWIQKDTSRFQTTAIKQKFDVDLNCSPQLYRTTIFIEDLSGNQISLNEQSFVGNTNIKTLSPKANRLDLPTDAPVLRTSMESFSSQEELSQIMTISGGKPFYILSPTYDYPVIKMTSAKSITKTVKTLEDNSSVQAAGYTLTANFAGAIFDIDILKLAGKASIFFVTAPGSIQWDTSPEFWNRSIIPSLDMNMVSASLISYASDQDSEANIQTMNVSTLKGLDQYSNFGAYWKIQQTQNLDGKLKSTLVSAGPIYYDKILSSPPAQPSEKDQWLKSSQIANVQAAGVQALANKVLQTTKKPLTRIGIAEAITQVLMSQINYDYSAIEVGGNLAEATAEDIIQKQRGTCQNFSVVFVAVARALGVPARIIVGVHLSDTTTGGHAWVEVEASPNQWIPFDPQNPIHEMDVYNYIPIWAETNDSYTDPELVAIERTVWPSDYEVTRTTNFKHLQ